MPNSTYTKEVIVWLIIRKDQLSIIGKTLLSFSEPREGEKADSPLEKNACPYPTEDLGVIATIVPCSRRK
ncbi:hypothetical protein MTR_4g132165 [Medicago truncatula]|uniref:Uncharacterized protein n=1 Tax=Medicago truncatula TaxID=3880 RepID=A0A072USK2_MEDTR|nr:hypothetical protein MTR_4g132165 [Medicago truncatula]